MGALTGHERIDRRSIALHGAIAEKLRDRPELMDIARENLDCGSESVRRCFGTGGAMGDLPAIRNRSAGGT